MFTEKRKPGSERRGRGRPPGETVQGATARQRLYATAVQLLTEFGYEATTLRDIAKKAGVSPGLLYRYFPSKQAVVLALYEELSLDYATRALELPVGTWHERFLVALKTSLAVLRPQRDALAALVPILVGNSEHGLFAPATQFSRERVQGVFLHAVRGAIDPLPHHEAAALGRVLYLVHLAIILWWLLDKSPHQSATTELVALLSSLGPLATLALHLPMARELLTAADALIEKGLFGGAGGSSL